MSTKFACLLVAAVPLCLSLRAPARAGTDVVIQRDVAMKTRDGVVLEADIYRPAGGGAFPVLLQSTPYDKAHAADFAKVTGPVTLELFAKSSAVDTDFTAKLVEFPAGIVEKQIPPHAVELQVSDAGAGSDIHARRPTCSKCSLIAVATGRSEVFALRCDRLPGIAPAVHL